MSTWDEIEYQAKKKGLDADMLREHLIHSYLESMGGKGSFDPGELIFKNPMSQLKLWLVENCVRHPNSTHHAQSCPWDIATLTLTGTKIGKELLANKLEKVDQDKIKSVLSALPDRIRSLLICLLIRDNELVYNPMLSPGQLKPIVDNVIRQLGEELYGRIDVDVLFPNVLQCAEMFGKELSNFGIGVMDTKDHIIKEWRSLGAFRTAPEVIDMISRLSLHDPRFLINIENNIIGAGADQITRLLLVSIFRSRKEISYLDLETIKAKIPEGSNEIEQFVARLKDEGYLSITPTHDSSAIIIGDPSSKFADIVKDIRSTMGHWWNEVMKPFTIKMSTLVSPQTPFSNKMAFWNMIRACDDYIYWVDKYFSVEGLEFLAQSLDKKKIKTIQILVSIDKVNSNLRGLFKDYKNELKNDEIVCELRVITNRELKSSIHDRWIISKHKCFNIPSTDTVAIGQYSEIQITENRPPFEQWWSQSLDIIEDWNKIQNIARSNT